MEKFDVYDSYGRKTGKTKYRNEKLQTGEYMLGINAYICNLNGEFLIQKRSKNKKILPGIWDVHMGHAIEGEESYKTLVRELKEELGIIFDSSNTYMEKRFLWDEMNYLIDIYFIVTDISVTDCVLQKSEVDAVKYVNLNDMIHLIKNMNRPQGYKKIVYEGINKVLQRLD